MTSANYIAGSAPFALGYESSAIEQDRQVQLLRKMIWLYFWLLIFEGALRKWIVPSLNTPLLIVRDPVVLAIYFQAVRTRRFPFNGAMVAYFALVVCFIVLAVIQIMLGIGGGPLVALYGIRTDFLHLPLIFVIPQVFSYEDVVKLGKWVLLLSIPMALLMLVQYRSGPTSWINAGVDGNAQQIAFVGGKIRPPGTFSFITGASHFFVLATVFLFYGLGERMRVYPRVLLCAAILSVAITQPVSGSRTLVLGCGLVFAAAVAFGVLNPNRAGKIVVLAVLMTAAVVALSFTDFFREAMTTFMARWNDANVSSGGVEEGVVGRVISWFTEPIRFLPEAGLVGKGIGMGTNAASAMLTGALVFLLAEGEWTRVVLECGPLLGFSYLAYRIWIAGTIAVRAAKAGAQRQLLPWLLAAAACISILTEALSQPTNLGFMVLLGGLCLASIQDNPEDVESWPTELNSARLQPVPAAQY